MTQIPRDFALSAALPLPPEAPKHRPIGVNSSPLSAPAVRRSQPRSPSESKPSASDSTLDGSFHADDASPPTPEAGSFSEVRRSGQSLAFLASMVVHVALLLVLALWVRQAGLPMAGIELVASRGEASSSQLEELSTFELAPQPEMSQAPEAEPTAESVELAYELDPLFGPPASDSGFNSALLNLSAGGDAASTLRSGSSDGGATFFGSYAQGNRFVYVLDSSRSMRGDRWTYACNELVDSLNKLKPEQEFFIICFDLRTTYLFNRKPELMQYESPTDITIAQVRRWLRGRTLGRATMPADALRAALEFSPDAIFLLSDGELQDGSLMMLRTLNPRDSVHRQIPIHTVHLFSPFGHNTLETIALENGGTFTHVGN